MDYKILFPILEAGFLFWIFESVTDFGENVCIREALMEIEAQITRALEKGFRPTHIDTHMGTYNMHPDLTKGVRMIYLAMYQFVAL
ncbi:MAG: ChbG/HpnK family deacetylase [Nitrospinales bacterium]